MIMYAARIITIHMYHLATLKNQVRYNIVKYKKRIHNYSVFSCYNIYLNCKYGYNYTVEVNLAPTLCSLRRFLFYLSSIPES